MHLRLWNLSARENINLYVYVGVLLAVGAVFGALLVHALTFEQQQDLAEHLGLYMKSAEDPGKLSPAGAFRESFLFYGKWLLLIWVLGISVIGLPVVLLLDFLKGVLIGFTVGLLAHELAWKGVLFFLAAVAPQNAIVVPALIIVSVSASRFAFFVVRERLFRRKGRLLPPFLAHTAAAVLMLGMLSLAALFEAYVSPVLLGRLIPHVSPAAHSITAADSSERFDFPNGVPL